MFKSIKWLPMPNLVQKIGDKEEKYIKFERAYDMLGTPNDNDRPMISTSKGDTVGVQPPKNFRFVKQCARKIVWCRECGRPRLIYSKMRLEDEIDQKLDLALEMVSYTCGGPIVDTSHELAKLFFLDQTKIVYSQSHHNIIHWEKT